MMAKWQMETAMKQARIVLAERGYTIFEQREGSTEFSAPCIYLVAAKKDGGRAEAYPRQTRGGVSYVIYED